MYTPPYSLLPNRWQNGLLFSLHSSLLQKSLHSGWLQLPSPPLGLKKYSRSPAGRKYSTGSSTLDLPPLNDPDTPTLLYRSSGTWFSPDISFAPSSLALSCSWEVLQDLGSDHIPILQSVPLSTVFRPNERPPSFNFQKDRWDDFASYLDSHCPSPEEYSCLSLSSAAALFIYLALKATKSSIPFGRIKRHSKAWWSAEVEGAVSKRRKAFASANKSDEERQAYIIASRRASSIIAKAKAETWQTTCSSLSPKSNAKTVYSLLRPIAGSPSSSSSSPNFPYFSSSRELDSVYAAYLRSHFSVSQPKTLRSRARGYLSELRRATFPGLTCRPALLSLPRNFLRLPPTFPRPLPLAQTMLTIPCWSIFLVLAWIFFFTFSIIPGLHIFFLPSGRHLPSFPSMWWESLSTLLLPSGLSLSPPVYQSCLNASFYLVYSSYWSLIPFSFPVRPVSALDGLL